MSVMTTLANPPSPMVPTPSTPRGFRPGDRFTPEQWLELPEWDGQLDPDGEDHWEVISGVLVVSTQPDDLHQLMALRLGALLQAAAPPGLIAIGAPTGLVVPGRHGLGPDAVVKRLDQVRDRRALPLLVAEILSPSTRNRDWIDKREAYAEAGVPSYWIGDYEEPSLSILELDDNRRYVEVLTLIGEESAVIDRPFPVRVCPADLVSLPGA